MTLVLIFYAKHHAATLCIVYSTQGWADTYWSDFNENFYSTKLTEHYKSAIMEKIKII